MLYLGAMECQKHLFDLDDETIYLNCAYMSPLLKSTAKAGYEGILLKSRPENISITDFFQPLDKLRRLFNTLINGDHLSRVVVVPSTSYGMANVAKNISPSRGTEILMMEH